MSVELTIAVLTFIPFDMIIQPDFHRNVFRWIFFFL